MNPLQDKLLELLKNDSRMSISQLAEITGASRKRVKDTIDRMLDRRVIKRFTIERGQTTDALPELRKAIFNVRLKTPSCRQLFNDIEVYDAITCAWSVSSSDLDMVIFVEATSMDEIEEVRNKIAQHPLVQKMFTNAILTTWRDQRRT